MLHFRQQTTPLPVTDASNIVLSKTYFERLHFHIPETCLRTDYLPTIEHILSMTDGTKNWHLSRGERYIEELVT